jgi:hypothetical protein
VNVAGVGVMGLRLQIAMPMLITSTVIQNCMVALNGVGFMAELLGQVIAETIFLMV